MNRNCGKYLMVLAACACAVSALAVNIETVTVGNAGNAGELSGGMYGPDAIVGAVNYTYYMGKFEITAAQYTEFLNAVADADPYALWDPNMNSSGQGCKIQRSGTAGNYTYSVAAAYANRPVNRVNFWDAARFANWLHNGQPTGAQGPTTTEDGAYTLNGYTGSDGRNIHRNAGAIWALPSENEWYKAAYHKNDGVTGNYWDYPMGSSDLPSNDLLDPDPGNNACFYQGGHTIGSPYYRTEPGAFGNSASPYGTFDQAGNASEWTDTVVAAPERRLMGGSFFGSDVNLNGDYRYDYAVQLGNDEAGFRVVCMIPEPASLSLLALTGLAIVRRR